jgi:acetyl esterase/lipase
MPDVTPEILDRPGREPDAVARYRDGADGVIDVYLPGGETRRPRPLVVLLHGGFWRAAYDRTHLRPFAAALADHGFAAALPEFRRVGGGGEWPVIGNDVNAALRAIPGIVAAHPQWRIDAAAPVTLVGHSAGGHLALWAGLSAGAGRVRRVVALAPVSDLSAAAGRGLGNGAVTDLLGGGPDARPDAYADADPLRDLPSRIPVIVVQGFDDEDVPADLNRPLAHRPGIRYVELAGVDHYALIDPLTVAWRGTVLPAISGAI